jgi:hypothetical protein
MEAEGKPPGDSKPKGFGQVWSKEEIDFMHEVKLQGEKCIAKRMCEFLPNKINKQIRDRRKQKTYKEQIRQLLSRGPPRQGICCGGSGRKEPHSADRAGRRGSPPGKGGGRGELPSL